MSADSMHYQRKAVNGYHAALHEIVKEDSLLVKTSVPPPNADHKA